MLEWFKRLFKKNNQVQPISLKPEPLSSPLSYTFGIPPKPLPKEACVELQEKTLSQRKLVLNINQNNNQIKKQMSLHLKPKKLGPRHQLYY